MNNNLWINLGIIRKFITKSQKLEDSSTRKSVLESLLEHLQSPDQDIQCECLLLLSAFVASLGNDLHSLLHKALPRIITYLGKTDLQLQLASMNFLYAYSKQIDNKSKFIEEFIKYGTENSDEQIQCGSVMCAAIFIKLTIGGDSVMLLLHSLAKQLETSSTYFSFVIYYCLKIIHDSFGSCKFYGALTADAQTCYKNFINEDIQSALFPMTYKVFERAFYEEATFENTTKLCQSLQLTHLMFQDSSWNRMDLLPYVAKFATLMGNVIMNSTLKVQLLCLDILEAVIEELKQELVLHMEVFIESLLKALACFDRKIRKKGASLIHCIISYIHPMPVIHFLLENVHGRNSMVRSEIINRITAGLLCSSSFCFDLHFLCISIVPFLEDYVLQVRQSALECLVTIGHMFMTRRLFTYFVNFLATDCHVSKRSLNVIVSRVNKGWFPVYTTEGIAPSLTCVTNVNNINDNTSDDSLAASTTKLKLSSKQKSVFAVRNPNCTEHVEKSSIDQGVSKVHALKDRSVTSEEGSKHSRNVGKTKKTTKGTKQSHSSEVDLNSTYSLIRDEEVNDPSSSCIHNESISEVNDYENADMESASIAALSSKSSEFSDGSNSGSDIAPLTADTKCSYEVTPPCSDLDTLEKLSERHESSRGSATISGFSYMASEDEEEEEMTPPAPFSEGQGSGDAQSLLSPLIKSSYIKHSKFYKNHCQNKKNTDYVEVVEYEPNRNKKNFNILTLDEKFKPALDVEEVFDASSNSCLEMRISDPQSTSEIYNTTKSQALLEGDDGRQMVEFRPPTMSFNEQRDNHPQVSIETMLQTIDRSYDSNNIHECQQQKIKKRHKVKNTGKIGTRYLRVERTSRRDTNLTAQSTGQSDLQETATMERDGRTTAGTVKEHKQGKQSRVTIRRQYNRNSKQSRQGDDKDFVAKAVNSKKDQSNNTVVCSSDFVQKDFNQELLALEANLDDKVEAQCCSKPCCKRNNQNQISEKVDTNTQLQKFRPKTTKELRKSPDTSKPVVRENAKPIWDEAENSNDFNLKRIEPKCERRASDQWSANIDFPRRSLVCPWAESFEEDVKELLPFDKPEQAQAELKQCYDNLKFDDQPKKVEYMLLCIRVATFHPEVFDESLLTRTLLFLLKETKNLRIPLAGQSVLTIGYLYMRAKPLESMLRTVLNTLLLKSGIRTFAGSYNAVIKSMYYLLKGVTHSKAVMALIQEGAQHSNKAVRETAAQFLALLAEKLGPQKCLGPFLGSHLLITAADFINDGSPLTRHCGKLMFAVFIKHPDFENLKKRYISDKIQFSTAKILNGIKSKGVDEEMIPIRVVCPEKL